MDQNENAKPTKFTDNDLKKYSGELPIWSILPSYSMFQDLLLNPNREDGDTSIEPPQYLASMDSSSVDNTSSVSTSILGLDQQESSSTTNNTVYFDDNNNAWQSTILDNVDLLNNMTDTDNKYASAIRIEIKFSKDVCRPGEAPELIDPSNFEYKQGDFINGYAIIENTSSEVIPFQMFYLIFEGRLLIKNTANKANPIKVHRFLEMFDFSGSYNSAAINRLVTDEIFLPASCPDTTDPLDNSYLHFLKRSMLPNRVYKRYFSFKIPEKLLDSQCSSYNLATHVKLPPSMGSNKEIKDFSFTNTAIEYGVAARFIGKGPSYKFNIDNERDAKVFNRKGDEYVILKDDMKFVRIIQQNQQLTSNHKTFQNLLHNNLLNRVDEKLRLGNTLSKLLEEEKYEDITKLIEKVEAQIRKEGSEEIKLSQLYVSSSGSKAPRKEAYEMVTEFTPKRFGIKTKSSPLFLKLKTPKTIYEFKYVSPKKFRDQAVDTSKYELRIPVELSLLDTSGTSKPPGIKDIICDLVCLTVMQDQKPIPIEFNHDLIFKNKRVETPHNSIYRDRDNFSTNVRQIFKEKAQEMHELSKKVDLNNLKVEASLVRDLAALANIKDKCNNLTFRNVKFEKNGHLQLMKNLTWEQGDLEYLNNFSINLNLKDLALKTRENAVTGDSFDEFTLIPDFQACFISRFYYARVFLVFTNGHVIDFKVPVSIVN